MEEHVAAQVGGVEAQVACGRVQVAVAEEDLDRAQVHAGLEQGGREGAPQGVWREVLRDAGLLRELLEEEAQPALAEAPAALAEEHGAAGVGMGRGQPGATTLEVGHDL